MKIILVVSENTNIGHLESLERLLKNQTETLHYSELALINNLKPDSLVIFCNLENYEILLNTKNFPPNLKSVPRFAFLENWNEKSIQSIYNFQIDGHFIPEEISMIHNEIEKVMEHNQLQASFHQLKSELEKSQRLLSTYVSSDIIEKNNLDSPGHTGGEILQATILIFDIRQSTSIAETIHPDIFSSFLSDLLSDIMDLIYGHGGHVNKMLGDGLLATFGCPTSGENDALNAVECALQVREYLKTYNDVRPDFIPFPIKAGIGISTGKVFAGDIGSVRKTEYTVLGDCVNTASRIESMTKRAGVDILIDGHTYKHTRQKVKVQKVIYKNIRGKQKAVDIYYLKGFA